MICDKLYLSRTEEGSLSRTDDGGGWKISLLCQNVHLKWFLRQGCGSWRRGGDLRSHFGCAFHSCTFGGCASHCCAFSSRGFNSCAFSSRVFDGCALGCFPRCCSCFHLNANRLGVDLTRLKSQNKTMNNYVTMKMTMTIQFQ